ncbi:hypothetical protein IWX46DRAFT_599934 [Phyllosticta citricarpa]|uniref:Uncharacterized protein n=1 Tax=Phyllosticta citricarpa TaxID=55181 RepID=A0ABR1MD19_9PEZI
MGASRLTQGAGLVLLNCAGRGAVVSEAAFQGVGGGIQIYLPSGFIHTYAISQSPPACIYTSLDVYVHPHLTLPPQSFSQTIPPTHLTNRPEPEYPDHHIQPNAQNLLYRDSTTHTCKTSQSVQSYYTASDIPLPPRMKHHTRASTHATATATAPTAPNQSNSKRV